MFDFFERWDLSIGIVSLVLVVPTVVHFIRAQLPSRRLRKLLELLSETEILFTASIEEGLLKCHETYTYQRHLTTLRKGAEEIRAEIYAGRGCGEEFSNLLHGLTRRINYLCTRVKKVRKSISTTSMRERERRRRIAAACRSSAQGQSVADSRPDPSRRTLESVWACICIFGARPDPQGEDDYFATPLSVVDTPATGPHVSEQASWSVEDAHSLSPPPTTPPPQPDLPDVSLATPSLARTDTDERTLCSQSTSARSHASRSTVSSPKWKLRGTPASRKRAVAQRLRRSRAARAKASRLPKAPTVPSSVLASLEPRSGGEEDEWVDVF